MEIRKVFPVMVMAYLVATGVLFLAASLGSLPFLRVEGSGRYGLLVISSLFVLLGIVFYILWQRGQLQRRGRTQEEIRKRAVRKTKDPAYLLRVLEDGREAPEVRRLAEERLKEITGTEEKTGA
ncbi:MAG: hypothetical protein JW821_18380 [Deltaproteobacteria bacterium]|nr:hypothetical protein [Deltaproteobacteria bacterium]